MKQKHVFVKSPLPVHEPMVVDIKEIGHRISLGYADYYSKLVLMHLIKEKGDNVNSVLFAIDIAEWIKTTDVCSDPECDCNRYESLAHFIMGEIVAYHIMISNDLNHNSVVRSHSKKYLDYIYGNELFNGELYNKLKDTLPKFISVAPKESDAQVQ